MKKIFFLSTSLCLSVMTQVVYASTPIDILTEAEHANNKAPDRVRPQAKIPINQYVDHVNLTTKRQTSVTSLRGRALILDLQSSLPTELIVGNHKRMITLWLKKLQDEILGHQNRPKYESIDVGFRDDLLSDNAKKILKSMTNELRIQGEIK